jgi:hypothetical protein
MPSRLIEEKDGMRAWRDRRNRPSSPVENIWQFMRDNWLSNRIFKSHEDILDHCCIAWNKFIDMPWKIISIGIRDWAYRP